MVADQLQRQWRGCRNIGAQRAQLARLRATHVYRPAAICYPGTAGPVAAAASVRIFPWIPLFASAFDPEKFTPQD